MKKLQNRILPVLLIDQGKLVKTVGFKKPAYIGDPINAVKIFNEKEVDEIILLDISKSIRKEEPDYDLIERICSEAFMPFAYGGGIRSLDHVDKLFQLGIEKVILNTALSELPDLVREISSKYGSQSVVGSVDVKKGLLGKSKVYIRSASKQISMNVLDYVKKVEEMGVGEIFLNSIDRDGSYKGYDLQLISQIASRIDVPLVACGGAKDMGSFKDAIQAGASACAAGSKFVYQGQRGGILISYPSQKEIREALF